MNGLDFFCVDVDVYRCQHYVVDNMLSDIECTIGIYCTLL